MVQPASSSLSPPLLSLASAPSSLLAAYPEISASSHRLHRYEHLYRTTRPCLPIYRAGVAASWLRYRTATAAAAWVPPLAPAEAEVSTMRKRMSVADIESSSTGEVAVLEELEDVIFQDYGKEQWSFGFWGNDMHRLTPQFRNSVFVLTSETKRSAAETRFISKLRYL
ncbi:hypothetical protein TRIUR3_14112 [Triticum urartu]|uniref:Uncharacterized protein n=1 Tax=Triticum urartu TaxID=4572 RepID=M7YF48_TRIUA|nr:hypothetical protein TRIUR3_14112 [Triticum urartu]